MLEKITKTDKVEMRPVVGYEGLYSVTPCGMVWSHPSKTRSKGKFLRQNTQKNGYVSVVLSKNGVGKTVKIHRIVAQAYIACDKSGLVVNHKDGNKSNNVVDNLEWTSPKKNTIHAWSTGLCKNTELSLKALELGRKLKRALDFYDAVDIRFLYSQGVTVAKIAEEYGIARAAIYNIVKHKTYKEVV